jgi:hypothetical protein
MKERRSLDRRTFLGTIGKGVATLTALGASGLPGIAPEAEAAPAPGSSLGRFRRRSASLRNRYKAALLEFRQKWPEHADNGDEAIYPNRIGSFTKCLPHNALGEVDPAAYNALLKAVRSGDPADFEAIPLGLGRKLVNPQSGLAFDLQGPDGHQLAIPPAPRLSGAEIAGEMVELYWAALCRDVPFSDYDTDPTVAAACAELSALAPFHGPKIAGAVTPGTVFRGNTPGDLAGPYLSQFLWLDIPMGALRIPQRMDTVPPGSDHMTSWADWLAIQNGAEPVPYPLDPTPRHLRSLRDLAEWVHIDALYQAYHQACLILLGMGAPAGPGNPYNTSQTQIGFGTFGGPHILSLVTEVATRALKAVWFQKWFVHRRLRPEAFGGLVHNTLTGAAPRPVHPAILNSSAVSEVFSKYGTYLLPMAAQEGSPAHPAYGAGHATVAGACVTVLKAFFDNDFTIPSPVVANADGTALLPYAGPPLTVAGELDKLAANVALGRNALGVHYRSDATASFALGESIALGMLREVKECHNEGGFWSLRKFDGTQTVI